MGSLYVRHRKPKEVRFGATVRARLPKDLEQVVRSARRMLGMSLSEFVRTGIEVHLVQMVPRWAMPDRLRGGSRTTPFQDSVTSFSGAGMPGNGE